MKTAKVLLLMFILPPLVYYVWLCVDRFDGALEIPAAALVRAAEIIIGAETRRVSGHSAAAMSER